MDPSIFSSYSKGSSLTRAEILAVLLSMAISHLRSHGIEANGIDGEFDLLTSGILESVEIVEYLMMVSRALDQPFDLVDLDFNRLGSLNALADQILALQDKPTQ